VKTQIRDKKTGRFTDDGNGHYGIKFDSAKELQQFEEIVANALVSRQEFFKSFTDPRRDIDDECGYPRTETLEVEDYREMYDKESVAARTVNVLPEESWQVQPRVFETEDVDNITPFEEDWAELPKSLRGRSWYQDEEGNPVWELLKRVDILSGIGSYGILLFGLDDLDVNQPLTTPVAGVEEMMVDPESKISPSRHRLLFVRAFDQSLVRISRFNTDRSHPRHGLPEIYAVTLNDPRNNVQGAIGIDTATVDVHWTRVLHVADNLGSSEVFGVPRQQQVFNRLYDLRKTYGGSAEMYWRGAFPGLSIESHPQLGASVSLNKDAIRSQMEQYFNGLQRYLAVVGASVKSIAPQVVEPSKHIDQYITAICILLGVPKRVFMGTERGQLASGQDDKTWNDRLMKRHKSYLTPKLTVPFIDRLIAYGVLREPEGYSVVWPDLNNLTDQEKAEVAGKRTESLAKYVAGDVETIITPVDYLVRIIGFSPEEAHAIVEAAEEAAEEKAIEEGRDNALQEDEVRVRGFNPEDEEGDETGEEDEDEEDEE